MTIAIKIGNYTTLVCYVFNVCHPKLLLLIFSNIDIPACIILCCLITDGNGREKLYNFLWKFSW